MVSDNQKLPMGRLTASEMSDITGSESTLTSLTSLNKLDSFEVSIWMPPPYLEGAV